MKKFLNKTGVFAVIIVFIFTILNVFQWVYNDDPPHYRLQYQEVAKNNDVYNGVIIGTSQATHGIRPSMIDSKDIQFYNFSLNGSSPEFYLKWYTHFFTENYSKVDYWIISVDNYFLSGDGWRKFEQDSEYFPNKTLTELIFEHNDLDKSLLISNRIPLLKYRSRMKEVIGLKKSNYLFLAEEYDKGYISLENRVVRADLKRSDNFRVELSEKSMRQFEKLIDLISKTGAKIIFVIPPEFDLKPEHYSDTKLFLDQISDQKGIPLLDFNNANYQAQFSQDSLFTNLNHLNKKGSKVLGQLLNKALYQNEGVIRQ